jgi:hypothetical protein
MLVLLKNIVGEVVTEYNGSVNLVKNVVCDIQTEDYINMYGLTAFLQDFSRIEYTSRANTPIVYGLKNQYDVEIKDIEISY